MIKNYLKIALILSMGLFLTNCEGEDGVAGLAGTNGTSGTDGTNGTDGTDGTNGIDGTNGEGFDELTKYGSITATITGTRIDDVAFTQTSEFKYTAVESEEISSHNSIEIDGSDREFELERFISAPDDVYQYNTVEIELDVEDAGLPSQSFDFDIRFNYHTIVGDDLKYFEFDDSFNDGSSGVTNIVISNYSFDDTTNALSFSYSLDVDGANNDTGNPLTISGEVNVIVLEEVSAPAPPPVLL